MPEITGTFLHFLFVFSIDISQFVIYFPCWCYFRSNAAGFRSSFSTKSKKKGFQCLRPCVSFANYVFSIKGNSNVTPSEQQFLFHRTLQINLNRQEFRLLDEC